MGVEVAIIAASVAAAASIGATAYQAANQPKTPDVPNPRKAEEEANKASLLANTAAEQQRKRAAAATGRDDTILTTPLGDAGAAPTRTKNLLGL